MSGGAWKVAYADFVTAMMALFMVLWISAQDEEVIIKTVQYFKDPFGVGFSSGAASGSVTGKKKEPGSSSSSVSQSSDDDQKIKKQEAQKTTMLDLALLNKLASEYYKKLNLDDTTGQENPVKVEVTADGLHITIFNKSNQPLFNKDTAEFSAWGKYIMQNLAWLVDRNPMQIRIDSHTYKGYEPPQKDYSAWDLTLDRSNAARKLLTQFSLKPNPIYQVSGFADSQPIPNTPPSTPSNERLEISLSLN